MLSQLSLSEFDAMLDIINDAAQAYKGVIPDDRWKEPYMSKKELTDEIDSSVQFYGWTETGILVGIMGIQNINDVTLIRHAYVLTKHQRKGIGKRLLEHLKPLAPTSEVLVGTWEVASWAINFYEKHGFRLVSKKETDRLLRKYWNIPERQIQTSVVLKLVAPDAK